MYSILCIFNHVYVTVLYYFLLITGLVDFTFHFGYWVNDYQNCWEAVFLFLSYGFLSDGILIPKSGISSLKTNCAASQMDNTASSIHENRQISLPNR